MLGVLSIPPCLYETSPQDDFDAFLREMNLTRELVNEARKTVPFAAQSGLEKGVRLADSPIEGVGIFANHDFRENALICPVMTGQKWSFAGRYMNHSHRANVTVERLRGALWFIAAKSIPAGAELTVNYRVVRDMMK